jgi:hypothetical protein
MDSLIDDDQLEPDPFAAFQEWASEDDDFAYADL